MTIRTTPGIAALLATFASIACLSVSSPAATNRLIDSVDPFIGTSGGGNTFPGAVAPFGMAQFTPSTRGRPAGYDYNTPKIEGFALTQMSGVGCDNFGDVFVTPTTGPVTPADYGSAAFAHKNEKASPGYYSVVLDRYNIGVELTATEHAGAARFAFPAGQQANLLIPVSHTQTSSKSATITVEPNGDVDGQVSSGSFCGSKEVHTVYFVIRSDTKPLASGVFADGKITADARSATQADEKSTVGAFLTFPSTTRTVQVTIGISYVDLAGARRNLDAEIGRRSFDEVRKGTEAGWERELHKIEITPAAERDLTIFYTALYHCLLMPSVFSDVDGRYVGFDGAIHTARRGHAVYENFSGWDIYRSDVTLLGLIEPRRLSDMCDSIALMAQQLGHIDRWPTANHPTGVMNGDPLSSMAATAWSMGLHDFDMPAIYASMTKAQTATDQFDQIGYIPGDVSTTEEYAYAFAAVADVARSMGKTADADVFTRRALMYRNLFNAQSGFLQPRTETGNWPPFSGTQGDGFTEGSGWQYIWLAPHDVAGLIACLGGDAAFNAKLDSFFAHPAKRWDARYYNPENEVDLEAPFLYNWSGQPWRAQSIVRELLASVYDTTPNGIPGNDDCGEMSSWYILASLGLYPTDPALPNLEIVSPIVKNAVIHLDRPYRAMSSTISTTGDGQYVQSVTVDGKPWVRNWLTADVLTTGKSIVFTLGSKPNEVWGAAEAERPPSMSDSNPLTFSPHIETGGFVGDDVTITDADPAAALYYTVDGSEPTQKSMRYASGFSMNQCGLVQARAFSPGRLPSLVASTLVTVPLPPSDGTGLSVTYFSKPDFTGSTVRRVDPAIDFGWPDGKPDKSIGPENFSARWEGEVKAPFTSDYTISTVSDDGVRVWIDGKLAIDDFQDHSPKTDSTHMRMEAGRKYAIKIDFFNHGYGSECRLMWSGPCLAVEVVPVEYLYPKHQ